MINAVNMGKKPLKINFCILIFELNLIFYNMIKKKYSLNFITNNG